MRHRVAAVGEVLWDNFPDGRRPGGAPCNVAYHASQLGDEGAVVTRVGMDADGEQLITFLHSKGVDVTAVQRDQQHPTGIVNVDFVGNEPHYTIVENVAWDHLEATELAASTIRSADAVCFGSLVQRSARSGSAVQELLRHAGHALTVFDVNLRPPFVRADVLQASLKLSNVVKMSASEVDAISTLLGQSDLVLWLVNDVGVKHVCVTYGKLGASMTSVEGSVNVAGEAVNTTDGDFVGVGDAFIAAMTHKLVREADPAAALRFANRYAALVATRRGAMPSLSPDDLAHVAG